MSSSCKELISDCILLLLEFQYKSNINDDDIIQFAIDKTTLFSKSKYGYIHLFNNKTNNIYLKAWSSNVIEECACIYENHYPLDKAGIWGDSIRLKTTVIHNDYENEPLKKELPEGHFKLSRHISVPILDSNNDVVLIIGVANKESEYNDIDSENIKIIGEILWSIIKNRKNEMISKFDYFKTILNRNEFENKIKDSLNTINNNYKILAHFNITNFKFICNIVGHQLSDKILKKISTIIKNRLSDSDIIGKLYEHEFCVLFNKFNIKENESICKKILSDILSYDFYLKEKIYQLRIDVGLIFLEYDENLNDIFSKIDTFFYLFKQNKKKRLIIYDYNLDDHTKLFYDDIINGDKIIYNFKKIENLNDREENIIELTTNIEKEQDYYIKNNNLSMNIEKYLINKIFDFNYNKINLIFIKISTSILLNKIFLNFLLTTIYKKFYNKICFEFDETDFKENYINISEQINNLKTSGCKICLYNFGNYLNTFELFKELKIDYIKINKNIIENICFSEIYRKILNLIIDLSEIFNIKIIAEDVSTETIYDAIQNLKINLIQGSHIDRKYRSIVEKDLLT